VRFGSPADRAAFTDELTREIKRLTERYHDAHAAQGRTFKFVVGGYPAPVADEPEAKQGR
jgi:hypothetical protein